MVEFGETNNVLDVLTQYEILEFCRLGLNRMKFYQTKTWDILTEKQISVVCRFIERLSKNPKTMILRLITI
jgi:hypothetical protein